MKMIRLDLWVYFSIGPAVRKLMEEFGVSMRDMTGSGPQNRITKA